MATLWISRRDCEEGTLPKLCLKCGQPATGNVEQDFFGTLLWSSPFSFLISLMGGWESVRLRAPMCVRHRQYWHRRRLVLSAAYLAGVLCCGLVIGAWRLVRIGAGAPPPPGQALTVLFLAPSFLVADILFILVYGPTGIRALEVHEDGVRLTNVHVDAVHQGDEDSPLGQLLYDGTLSKFQPDRPSWHDKTRGE